MKRFSQRNGYANTGILYKEMTTELKNRLWNIYYMNRFDYDRNHQNTNGLTNIEVILHEMGLTFVKPIKPSDRQANATYLANYLLDSKKWYTMYDFLEIHVSSLTRSQKEDLCKRYNTILKEENSAYRFVDRRIVAITNEQELQAINEAANTKYSGVNTHIKKAISLLSYKNHDYENVIKESVSAVESLCNSINGNDTSLGQALKKLENKGVKIPQSLQNSMSNLYGYASSTVRHGTGESIEVSLEDARFILVWCSGFVNYLIEKWEKAQ